MPVKLGFIRSAQLRIISRNVFVDFTNCNCIVKNVFLNCVFNNTTELRG